MKKNVFFCCCFLFFVLSCSKTEEITDSVSDTNVEVAVDSSINLEEAETTTSLFRDDITGVIYVNDVSLYVENEDGKMKWARSCPIGEKALYLGEKKEATRTDGQKRTFYNISYDNTDYWIQDYCYEPDTSLGFIVSENTLLYKDDSLAAATSEVLPQFFIVAVYNDSLKSSSKFVKIATYNTDLTSSWVVKDKYVKREAVEVSELDVQAMLLANVAAETKNEVVRKELFTNAMEMGSKYTDDIALLGELTERKILENEYLSGLKTETVKQKITLDKETEVFSIPKDSQINDQAKPSGLEPRLLGTLKANTSVTATKRLVIDAIENTLVVCYYVESGQYKGWIEVIETVKVTDEEEQL